MAALNENAISLLSRVAGINAELDAPTLHQLYIVPASKWCVIDQVVIYTTNGLMTGMTDVDFGGGVAAATPTWKNAVDLSVVSSVNKSTTIRNDAAQPIMLNGSDSTLANRTFSMLVTVGATGTGVITVDVFGYLHDL